eukprot:scaffold81445_cov66-Phaeocystis_antarctica.AAC.1
MLSANAAAAVFRPAASGASMRTMATRGKAHVGGTVRPGRSAKPPSASIITPTIWTTQVLTSTVDGSPTRRAADADLICTTGAIQRTTPGLRVAATRATTMATTTA